MWKQNFPDLADLDPAKMPLWPNLKPGLGAQIPLKICQEVWPRHPWGGGSTQQGRPEGNQADVARGPKRGA